MSDKVKLAEIPRLLLEVELPDGSCKTIDPYDVIRRLEPFIDGQSDFTKPSQIIGVIRQVLGVDGEVKDHQAIFLVKKIMKMVNAELEAKE